MHQSNPQPVQRLPRVDRQRRRRVSKVVGAGVGQARGCRMGAHQIVDGRHGEPPVLVPEYGRE